MPTDPLYNEIDATNLESVRKNVVFDNLFVDTPFQAKLRKAGVFDPFLGGNGMMEGFIYGRVQGAAVAPGSSVTVTRQQLNTGMKFQPKAYVAWAPLDDWELDDGSGTGGVINSGPSRIANQYQILMENMTSTINTMLEMDSFRHGQASGTGVTGNRILNSNGLSEALNNGVDPSWDGNVFTTYGSQTRNGVIGPALNSTPLYLGSSTGATGQIDFNALMTMWGQLRSHRRKTRPRHHERHGLCGRGKRSRCATSRREQHQARHSVGWVELQRHRHLSGSVGSLGTGRELPFAGSGSGHGGQQQPRRWRGRIDSDGRVYDSAVHLCWIERGYVADGFKPSVERLDSAWRSSLLPRIERIQDPTDR
jgi:hypothetical protein